MLTEETQVQDWTPRVSADSELCVQTWGSVQGGPSSPDVQSFLSSVDQFVSNLSSARVSMERKFQLQQVDLPDVIGQLSSPADYTAAGRGRHPRSSARRWPLQTKAELMRLLSAKNSELVEHLEGVVSAWTNQIKQVLTESEQLRKEAEDVGPSAELEHWKRRMVTFNRWETPRTNQGAFLLLWSEHSS